MKRLIVNADDFGWDDGVARGIIDLYEAGLVSSSSCMTNMSAWPQAAAYLRQHPEAGAGVHLVFNKDRPVLPAKMVPALVGKDGQFLNDGQILRSFRPGTMAQLRAEFQAQIERFVQDVGRPPDHLDNHCSVSYARPDRFRVTLELAREYGLPIRAAFGDDLDKMAAEINRIWRFPVWLIQPVGSAYRRRVDRAGIGRPNTLLLGFSPRGPRTVDRLLSVIESAHDGWISELLTHPGYDGDWREEELCALLDPRVRARLDQPDIELVDFSTDFSASRLS
jgi:predicted glycoside hydrolase/deacetylase ChbG (UPF0249 family)